MNHGFHGIVTPSSISNKFLSDCMSPFQELLGNSINSTAKMAQETIHLIHELDPINTTSTAA